MNFLKPMALIAGGIITGCILMIFMKDGKPSQPSESATVMGDDGQASESSVEAAESPIGEDESDNAAENFQQVEVSVYDSAEKQSFTVGDPTEMIELVDEKNKLSIRTPKDGFHFYKRAEVKKPTNTIEAQTWRHPDFYTNLNYSGRLSFLHGEPYNIAIVKQNYNQSLSIDEALHDVYYQHEMAKEHYGWGIRPTLTYQYDYPLFAKVQYLYRITTEFDTFYEGAFAFENHLYIFSIRVEVDTWLDDPIMEEYWAMLNTLQTANGNDDTN